MGIIRSTMTPMPPISPISSTTCHEVVAKAEKQALLLGRGRLFAVLVADVAGLAEEDGVLTDVHC